MPRLASVLAAILAVTVGTGTVSASSYSLGIGSPTVNRSRVAITVPVEVTCPALDPSYTLWGQSITVSIEQAAGNAIAYGTGSAFGHSPDSPLVVCDGTPKTVSITVLADPASRPFSRGWLSVTASAEFWAGVEFEPGCGCGSILIDEFFGFGPVDRLARG
jgi:hypothetical protein